MRGSICGLVIVLALLASTADALDDWTQLTPTSHPSARTYLDMAYIGQHQVLLFGGWVASSPDDQTWVYDLGANAWTQKSLSTKPSARYRHAMAYIGGDQVLLFGGDAVSKVYDDKTWIYDLGANSWTLQNPPSKPSGRFYHAMAYIGGDQVLLFGGYETGGFGDETWVYDLSETTWTQKSPPAKPSKRRAHAMAHIGGDQVLLFGGSVSGVSDDETWIYDLSANTWTQKNPSTKPSTRYVHAMAYLGEDQVLLFGGNAAGYNDETWIYDLSDDNWAPDSNTTQPSARYTHGLAETSMDGSSRLVLFGGWESGGPDDETWTFGGGDYPLPVILSSFTATGGDRMVTLRWTTQSEWDNRGFHLYRSEENCRDFSRITTEQISGAGNSSTSRDYIWEDRRVENGLTYWYQLESVDLTGETQTYGPVNATPMASQPDRGALPATCRLFPNYPNPFNPETWIDYQLSQGSHVSVEIYNIEGQLIRTLVDGQQEPGFRRVRWDGRDLDGSMAASGVYFCRLKTERLVETTKMILLR